MGDIADYHLEQMMWAEMEEENEMAGWLKYSDENLKKAVIENGFYESDFSELAESISNSLGPLSKKQRWCLAKYLVRDNRR